MTKIEYEGKNYYYSWLSIILFVIFVPIISVFVYWLIADALSFYTHRMIVEQTCDIINFLNLFDRPISWGFNEACTTAECYYYNAPIIGEGVAKIGFGNMCTGYQANAIFAGVISMAPHSKDKDANKYIWLRKIIAFVVSWLIFYVVNLIRMVIQLTLLHHGAPWEEVHTSISAASSFIAVIIMLVVHRWIPELILAIVWVSGEIKSFKDRREEINLNSSNNQKEVLSKNTDLKKKKNT